MHASGPWRFSQVSYAVGWMCRFIVIAVALLASCGDEQLDQLTTIKKEVCACKTVVCGETAMKKLPQRELKSDRKMQHVASAMLDCLAKLYDERPTSPESADPASAETP